MVYVENYNQNRDHIKHRLKFFAELKEKAPNIENEIKIKEL